MLDGQTVHQKCIMLRLWHAFAFYLVVVYQVENQVYVSMNGLVLSQLRFHFIQPVNESLEGVCELAGEEQGLLQLVLSAGEDKRFPVNHLS